MNIDELKIVDATTLPDELRALLKPDALVDDANGVAHKLPRYFYEVPGWEEAKQIFVAPHFKLSEFMTVDVREAERLLNTFPHYVPCAVLLLAQTLEHFRRAADGAVYVSANGGYRSPSHQLSAPATLHCWATAANIYRVGSTYLDDADSIAKHAKIAESLGAAIHVKPYVEGDDHLHIDIGFVRLTPPQQRDD